MDNKTIYELKSESGRAVNITGNHPYLVRFGGYIRNLNGGSTNNLPLNSYVLTLLNKSDNASVTVLMTGGTILMNTIPSCSSGGNKSMLPKCLSNDSITLPSVFAILDINSSLDLRGDLLTSNPLFVKNSKTNFGIFSSVRIFSLPDSDIFFLFEKLGGVFNSGQDGFLRELREVIPNNLFWSNASSKQGKNLPDHDTGIFESKLSMADFTVSDNEFIDFVSHEPNNRNVVFKDYGNSKFGVCQEPPVKDWWNKALAYVSCYRQVVLEHARKFCTITKQIGFQPPVIDQWKISDI